MEAFYDVEPQKLSNVNNGSYIYRINIQEIEIPALNENETITQWRCDEFVIWGIITSNKITDAVINSLWNKDYEQKLINDYNIYFQHVYNVVNDEIPYYMNAADVLLLTSYHEGSPNVIKEAMACNCPIVATDVGDVRQIIGNTRGCYISTSDPGDVADKIKKALDFNNRTNGREVINSLGLDSGTIARKIVALYSEALKSKKTS